MTERTTIDARGHRCPVPTLRLRRALEAAEGRVEVILVADDPMARIDVPHFAREAGCAVVVEETGGSLVFTVTRPPVGSADR